ncbi:MAG: hypothetical protein AB4057_00890 [Crocosphaera sp.]
MNLTSTIFKSFLSVSLLPFLSSSSLLSNNNIAQAQGTNIPFDVCFNSDTFVRPSNREQINFIRTGASNRIISGTTDEDIINHPFWTSNIYISIIYEGGSGTGDLQIFSGLSLVAKNDKNLADGIRKCAYKLSETNPVGSSSFQPNPKNQLRLFNYKLKQIKWVNNKYVLLVEPRNSGFQFIHYNKTRQDLASKNPVLIEVIDTNGRKLGSCREEFSCRI